MQKNSFDYYDFIEKPSQDDLKIYYENKYFQNNHAVYNKLYTDWEIENILNYYDIIYYISKKYQDIKNVIDLGCGEGFSLKFFKNINIDAYGIDFSDHGIKNHNPDLINNFKKCDVYKNINIINNYDTIICNNILEHVNDVNDFLNKIHENMKTNSICIFAVPNDFSIIQNKLLTNNLVDNQYWISYPEHLSYFNLSSLLKLFEYHDFQVLDYITTFPIDFFLFNDETNYIKNKTIGKKVYKSVYEINSLLLNSDKEKYYKYLKSQCELGIGRDIIIIIKKN